MAAFLPRVVNKQRGVPPPCKKPRRQSTVDDVGTEPSSSDSAEHVNKVEQAETSTKDGTEAGSRLSDDHSDGSDADDDE